MKNPITIKVHIHSDIETVWNSYTSPEHIKKWNTASDDWHCPEVTNDLQVGGEFKYTMAAKDGSMSFDFSGKYTEVKNNETIAYTMDDERKVKVQFQNDGHCVNITMDFEPESENDTELQKNGWQSILNHFADYVETL